MVLRTFITRGIPEKKKMTFFTGNNFGTLLRYNDEKTFIDFWLTRVVPYCRAQGGIGLAAFLTDAASDSFYKQIESYADGIIDFSTKEKEMGRIEQYVRVRMAPGMKHVSGWRQLELLDNGEVVLK